MTTIVGISGSLRRRSYNAALLRATAAVAPDAVDVEILSIEGIPLYNADVQEEQGFPRPVEELKRRLRAADGLILATPEYNHSVPGVLKNAIDWASRPASDIPAVFGDLPVGILGAGGRSGTRFAQTALLPVFRTLQMRPWFGRMVFAERAWELFDDAGEIADPKLRERVADWTSEFAQFCRDLPRQRFG